MQDTIKTFPGRIARTKKSTTICNTIAELKNCIHDAKITLQHTKDKVSNAWTKPPPSRNLASAHKAQHKAQHTLWDLEHYLHLAQTKYRRL